MNYAVKVRARANDTTVRSWSNGPARVYVQDTDGSLPLSAAKRQRLNEYRRALAACPDPIVQALVAAGLSWSRTAGCRCGCSPGFVAPRGGFDGLTVYVDVRA